MPDHISNLQNNLIATGLFRLTGLSLLEVLTESLISILQPRYESVCLDFPLEGRWLLRGLILHHRMEVVFGR